MEGKWRVIDSNESCFPQGDKAWSVAMPAGLCWGWISWIVPWAAPPAWQSGRDWHGGDTAPADEGEVADRAALLNGDTAGMGGQG